MDPTTIPLFALADRRLAWLNQRLTALAGNVANADTPGFQPRDLAPFATALDGVLGGTLAPVRTSPLHLVGGGGAGFVRSADGERAPDGNGVSLDKEMLRVSETEASAETVQNVFKKYLSMFRTAAGR